ncbi:hypothetical protein GCM10022380_67430 [Amycolatopsis tucumanensis]|uniref:Uncharacterized protein n=1 Tax=Amycolatopsis tucumanensis TaxID=401106 RepID=A0ABP7JC07_9PSEU
MAKRSGDPKAAGPVGRVVRHFPIGSDEPNRFRWDPRIEWDEKGPP